MNHGSLFSGIGGFDLAASWIGWNNVFQCEKDPFCQQVLKHYFPNTMLYGDITTSDFRKYRGQIDVLSGGFPCQPFSLAGQRKGKDDDRYLWPQMLRVIDEVRPAWVVGENVAGITSMVQPGDEINVESQASLFEENYKETILEQEYVIETVCKDLERIGYSVQPVIIPACGVGAPHRRDRVWFLAYSNSNGTGLQTERAEQQTARSSGGGSQGTFAYSQSNGGYRASNETGGATKGQNGEEAEQFKFGGGVRDAPNPSDARIKSVQREGEDGICQSETSSHPNNTRSRASGFDDFEKREKNCEKRGNAQSEHSGYGNKKTVADPSFVKSQQRTADNNTQNEEQNKEGTDCGIERPCDNETSSHPQSEQSKRSQPEQRNADCQKQGQFGRGNSQTSHSYGNNWRNFPTQSPVCSRNDGFSYRLDSFALSNEREPRRPFVAYNRWRAESVKAYGNAIVPQVAYEIFRIINLINQ